MVGQQVDAMADPEHLAKLREGIKAWNRWRAKNPKLIPDLRNADLNKGALDRVNLVAAECSGAHLFGAEINEADLRRANLSEADLEGASLEYTKLNQAVLEGTNFDEARLSRTRLRQANLGGASLKYTDLFAADMGAADLIDANFTGAALGEANLKNATIGYTTFANVDLSTARGLEMVAHAGPSTIGIDTIYRSKGNIPESFLRGCGVPETFITFAKSLVVNPIEFYSCFISYSSKDDGFATELHTKLAAQSVRCWFAPEDLKIGDRFQERIEESIRLYDKLLVVLSENSVNSPWVEREVQAAFEKEQRQGSTVLFPVRLDDAVMDCPRAWAAEIRRTRHVGDFRKWKDHDSFQKSLDRLLRDLKSQDSKPK